MLSSSTLLFDHNTDTLFDSTRAKMMPCPGRSGACQCGSSNLLSTRSPIWKYDFLDIVNLFGPGLIGVSRAPWRQVSVNRVMGFG